VTMRVGRVGRHIKPNNFSIIYISKNFADQKKTVFTYLLLNELSDVSEKKVSLIGTYNGPMVIKYIKFECNKKYILNILSLPEG